MSDTTPAPAATPEAQAADGQQTEQEQPNSEHAHPPSPEQLRELIDLMEGASMDSAEDGIFAIEDSEFETYAEELAEDVCEDWRLIRDRRWPFSCIDWEKAADELQVDYTEFEWQGYTYWTR